MGSHSRSRESSWFRDWTLVSHIAGGFFTVWATREAPPKKIDLYVICIAESIYCTPETLKLTQNYKSIILQFKKKLQKCICWRWDPTIWLSYRSFHALAPRHWYNHDSLGRKKSQSAIYLESYYYFPQ